MFSIITNHPFAHDNHPSARNNHPYNRKNHPYIVNNHPYTRNNHPSARINHSSARYNHPSTRNNDPSGTNPRLLALLTPGVCRVIAVLLGVREEQVTAEHRSSLLSFPQWVHLEAR